MAGWARRCWRERTSRNRQLILAAGNMLNLKTHEGEWKHMSEEVPRRWFLGGKSFPLLFSTKTGCKLSTQSAEEPTFGMASLQVAGIPPLKIHFPLCQTQSF